MRLIVHMGLHKTGSTYLQHVMNDNHDVLRRNGVYYARQSGYPAHHSAAWDVLRGDAAPITRMIADARRHRCHTTVLSSEDLEGAVFYQQAVAAIESAAAEANVETLEWHMCVREPGDVFGSLYAQLQYHLYADPVAMLCEVLRDGMMMVIDPVPGGSATPFWGFVFDHYRYISQFARQTRHPVILHDFRDDLPFPGATILSHMRVLDDLESLPGEAARNRRLSPSHVRQGHADQVLGLLSTEGQREKLGGLVREHIRRGAAAIDTYAEAVGEQFDGSLQAALNEFGYRA